MTMTHPGLPWSWGTLVILAMVLMAIHALARPVPGKIRTRRLNLNGVPVLGILVHWFTTSPWPLLALKLSMVAVFLLVIAAGLFGTPIPERNIATMLTWTLWWTGLIISIFFLGSAWCAVCPWDSIAGWLVRRRLWRRGDGSGSLGLRVPRVLRNIWPALLMFFALTWLELGAGITTDPYATALIALFLVVAATVSLALYERKAFCRYFCPIGRTIGFYAQLAPVELRPRNMDTCIQCKTLDCYHGSADIEPCPTHLVMGRLTQNTYCTSCGACVMSCPYDNVSWRLRPVGAEAMVHARPHHDEAWFILGLAALTSFHGITMLPFWEKSMLQLAQFIGDNGRLLPSFTIGMLVMTLVPVLLYSLAVTLTRHLARSDIPWRRLFAGLAFAALPPAFSYHIAHNLNHLVRESSGLLVVLGNPFGPGNLPLSLAERHERLTSILIPESLLFMLLAGLSVLGFWLAVQVLRHRGASLLEDGAGLRGVRMLPMLGFSAALSGFNLWLLMQPMVMRM